MHRSSFVQTSQFCAVLWSPNLKSCVRHVDLIVNTAHASSCSDWQIQSFAWKWAYAQFSDVSSFRIWGSEFVCVFVFVPVELSKCVRKFTMQSQSTQSSIRFYKVFLIPMSWGKSTIQNSICSLESKAVAVVVHMFIICWNVEDA